MILGPTASGKSGLAIELCERLDGEILNADSRQVYRHLDVGTAKPGPAERARVPHHLFDLVEPEATFSAAEYSLAARQAIREVHGRGRLPVVVGGTGLYLRALLQGLFPGPGRDPGHHGRLLAICERGGLPRLHRWLQRVDPEWAAKVGAGDRQRILRGLDVWLQTGSPITDLIRRQAGEPPSFQACKLGWSWPRAELYRRIEQRVDRMMTGGFLDEVRRLSSRPGFTGSNAAKSVGYAQLLDHLEGRIDLAGAVVEIKRDTRRLAKRQLTWFRREPAVTWVPAS